MCARGAGGIDSAGSGLGGLTASATTSGLWARGCDLAMTLAACSAVRLRSSSCAADSADAGASAADTSAPLVRLVAGAFDLAVARPGSLAALTGETTLPIVPRGPFASIGGACAGAVFTAKSTGFNASNAAPAVFFGEGGESAVEFWADKV